MELDDCCAYTSGAYKPAQLLAERMGDCKANALLVAATLEKLGHRAVLLGGLRHVIAAAVVSVSEEGETGLLPIDANIRKASDLNADDAIKKGREFAVDAIGARDTISDTQGRILWGRPRGLLLGGCLSRTPYDVELPRPKVL